MKCGHPENRDDGNSHGNRMVKEMQNTPVAAFVLFVLSIKLTTLSLLPQLPCLMLLHGTRQFSLNSTELFIIPNICRDRPLYQKINKLIK